MLQVKKSRAKKILGPAPCVHECGNDEHHKACFEKLSKHPEMQKVDITVIPQLSPHAMPTYLTYVSNKETTYLHLTNLTDGSHTQVVFAPINPNQICVFLAADQSRITLGIFDFVETLSSVTITSFGEANDDARLCFMQFGPWTWAISEELVMDFNIKSGKHKWVSGRPNNWFDINVLRHPTPIDENNPSTRISREPAAVSSPLPEGSVKTFTVKEPTNVDGGTTIKVVMQELPNGVSRWFSVKNGICVWSGFGYARDETGNYNLFWRNGSLFARGVGFDVCVAALGGDDNLILA